MRLVSGLLIKAFTSMLLYVYNVCLYVFVCLYSPHVADTYSVVKARTLLCVIESCNFVICPLLHSSAVYF